MDHTAGIKLQNNWNWLCAPSNYADAFVNAMFWKSAKIADVDIVKCGFCDDGTMFSISN